MTKILDTMDELEKGLGFVRAASMAVRGSGLDRNELNALDRIIASAEDALEGVRRDLEEIFPAKVRAKV